MALIVFGFFLLFFGTSLAFGATSLKGFSASKDAPLLECFSILSFSVGVFLIGLGIAA